MSVNNSINSSYSENITPYIVGSDPVLYKYQSIQVAITQASADGASAANPKVILISAGTYNETITLTDGIIVRGMNSSRDIHATKLVGEVMWNGTNAAHIGAIEDFDTEALVGQDCIDVGINSQGILNCKNCKFNGSAGNRCVNWATNTVCTLRLNNCLLVGGPNESISIRNFGDLFMINSRFETDKGSLQFQITQNATALVFNSLLEGRVQSQDDAEMTLLNSVVDYSLGATNHGFRVNTGSKATAKNCIIITNNAATSAVGIQGGMGVAVTRCELLQCELLSISSSGDAIERAGVAAPDPTLSKGVVTATGTASGIEAGITVTNYPSV